MKPQSYEIFCDKCGGTNLAWSEYEHKIWCYDCKIDTDGTGGIFDGPICWEAAQMLGASFARFNLKKNRVEWPRFVGNKIMYFAKKENK